MVTMAENVIVACSENRPLILEKGMYDSWKTQIMLYIQGKENGELLIDSIKNGPVKLLPEITVKDTDGVTDIRLPQKVADLYQEEKLRYDSYIRTVNIILLGLPVDIYILINHFHTAKEIWDRVKELMEGTEMTKQERKEQQDFLADSLEETNDCEDLQLQATANFKAYHVDAYDLDCDDEATANAIFMANLAPVGSLNDDTVAPRYDSDTLFEVPHYDTYHDSNVLNSNIQELGYIENIVSTNESYDELKGNNDVISYTNYMLTIGDDADNYVPPPVQKNDMMLSVIKLTKSQVENCNKVNQESNSEIESLTSELERYKDRVGVLGYTVKDGHSEQEAYLSHELYTVINDRFLTTFSLSETANRQKVN
ncbi:hypothetical protein Tco_1526019 [Tanacetum coccineum]